MWTYAAAGFVLIYWVSFPGYHRTGLFLSGDGYRHGPAIWSVWRRHAALLAIWPYGAHELVIGTEPTCAGVFVDHSPAPAPMGLAIGSITLLLPRSKPGSPGRYQAAAACWERLFL